MAVAGKVAPVPKGAWESGKLYEKLNIVTHNNAAYMAKKDSFGQEPSLISDYWMFLVDSSGNIATTLTPGKVMPDGDSISVDASGKIKADGVADVLRISDVLKFTVTDEGLLRVFYNS